MDLGPLRVRRVHFAGSASRDADATLLRYTHEIVMRSVHGLLDSGGRLVTFVGREDRSRDGLPTVFYWTVLESVARWLEGQGDVTQRIPLAIVVTSEKARSEIPQTRRALWDSLLARGVVHQEAIPPGWRSGALIRQRQAKYGNLLVTISGGAGVEHLAQLYRERGNPVIPLDPRLGASREEPSGGYDLARAGKSDATALFELRDRQDQATARLLALETDPVRMKPEALAERVVALMRDLAPPRAFYVRLMNREHGDHASVEHFFREVVDPMLEDEGYLGLDLSIDPARSLFLNLEIFQRLHHSALAVVDFTGTRENVFLEGGYALGRQLPVVLAAREGTELPFDAAQLGCHFWDPDQGVETERRRFRSALRSALVRPPLIE